VDRLEPFRPEGLASRILGMGDIVGLVQDFEAVVDEKQAEEDAERILGGRFTMDDLLNQLRTLQKMGPLRDVLGKLPMFGSMAEQVDEREIVKVQAMIHSMTRTERSDPRLIDKSRARRIAQGSGRQQKEIFDLVQRFSQMREIMGSLGSGGGLLGKVPGLGRLAGAGGPGLDPAALLGGPGGPNRAARGQTASRQRQQQTRKRTQTRKARRKGRRR
jgi:signal recognition particle subunit SRP54